MRVDAPLDGSPQSPQWSFESGRDSSPHWSHGQRSWPQVAIPNREGLSATSCPHCCTGSPHSFPRILVFSFPHGGSKGPTGTSESLRRGRGTKFADVGLRLFSPRHDPLEEPPLRSGHHLGLRRSRGTHANSSTAAGPIQLVSTPLGPGGYPMLGQCFVGQSARICLGPVPGPGASC
ncbi:hypothetical protein NDU88_002494 [Pleurodeles waltl]|uniref:Uncharacterized protein n=1 Tax=Pleurodeles waltl TaxID=8319 RepID=A0AAV7REP1_PLEWA|nr:hypothetical protein NDU88_002494 [Pleurodeles waltl]